jgi:hypothetical protein
MAAPRLALLPADLLTRVARSLDDVEDVLRYRLAARWLRALAARAVGRLRAARAALPREAWEAFPEASGVVIELDARDSNAALLLQLLPSLPARLQDLTIESTRSTGLNGSYNTAELLDAMSAFCSQQQLGSHPCAQHLTELDLSRVMVLPSTALSLLSLPSLQRCRITVEPPSDSPPVQLASLPAPLQELSIAVEPVTELHISPAALAACSGLTSLSLNVDEPRSLGSITRALPACPQLQSLGLWVPGYTSWHGQQDLGTAIAAVTASLPQLHTLSLWRGRGEFDDAFVTAQQWQQLAQRLPGLQHLTVHGLELGPGSPPAPQLTRLEAELRLVGFGEQQQGQQGQAGAGAAAGALLATLPALQRLTARGGSVDHQALLAALQGHPQLTWLTIRSWDRAIAVPRWPGNLLGGVPHLRQVLLQQPGCSSIDDLLADAAGCAQLEELEVESRDGRFRYVQAVTGAGLAALAAGPCRHTLRRLVLDTRPLTLWDHSSCFSIGSAAQMLEPGALAQLQELQLDVQLQELQLDVQLQGGPAAAGPLEGVEAQVVRRVAQQLEALGVPGAADCFTVDASSSAEGARLPEGVPMCGAVHRQLGRPPCQVRLNVWLPREERHRYGLTPWDVIDYGDVDVHVYDDESEEDGYWPADEW